MIDTRIYETNLIIDDQTVNYFLRNININDKINIIKKYIIYNILSLRNIL